MTRSSSTLCRQLNRLKYSAPAYRMRQRLARYRRAWLYAAGRTELDDAYTIMRDLRPITGEYPLITLDVDGIVISAGDRWTNSADEIRPFAEEAAERVYGKFDSDGETRSAAEEWALDLIAEYAEQEGVELIEGEREEGED